jgi:hypothetical protein
MNNLGLSELTDDQLMELLQEMCMELSTRDPIVRQVAQKTIYTKAEHLKARRIAMKEAIQGMRKRYVKGLKEEIAEAIQQQIKRGEIRVVTEEEERTIRENITIKQRQLAAKAEKLRIGREVLDDLKRQVFSGSLDLRTQAEKDKLVQEAVESATQWLKNQGTISIIQFASARRAIIDNLIRMGHSESDIMKIYGKP